MGSRDNTPHREYAQLILVSAAVKAGKGLGGVDVDQLRKILASRDCKQAIQDFVEGVRSVQARTCPGTPPVGDGDMDDFTAKAEAVTSFTRESLVKPIQRFPTKEQVQQSAGQHHLSAEQRLNALVPGDEKRMDGNLDEKISSGQLLGR